MRYVVMATMLAFVCLDLSPAHAANPDQRESLRGLPAEVTLHIPPLFQERPSWCWAAVGEMVFKYYDIPAVHRTDYQCGIVQGRNLCTGLPNCVECALSAVDETAVVNMLEQYPVLATQGGKAGEIALTVQLKSGSLSEAEVKHEIDEGRPIIVGLSPRGFKVNGIRQHMALIVGYDNSSGDLMLTVNDPFPFEDMVFLWIGSPYVNARASEEGDGRYEVGYDAFRSKLKWTQTLYRMTCTGPGCPSDDQHIADSSVGKDDRDVIQTVLTASAGDFKSLRAGHKAVDAETGTTWQSTVTFSGAKPCLVRDKDDHGGAKWSCIFKFADRSEADKAVVDIVKRLRKSLPQGWIGTDLDVDSETEIYTKTDKFSTSKPGSNQAITLYFIDTKKDGRVKVYLSVEHQ
ncbi:MAG: papain-like cysteine protease family protein [Nitrospirota bacterium]